MRVFRDNTPEIVPHAAENLLNLSRGLVRIRSREIGAAGAVFGEPRAHPPHDGSCTVGDPIRVGAPDALQKQHGEPPGDRVGARFERRAQSRRQASGCGLHRGCGSFQKLTTILPNTCRLSRRSRPRAKSARSTSVSITGLSLACILARPSRMLRMEAPNEPKMRYCCWNNCIRLKFVVAPEVAPQVTRRPPRLRESSEPLKVSAPTCSNTTSTPFLAVILRTRCSKRSVR